MMGGEKLLVDKKTHDGRRETLSRQKKLMMGREKLLVDKKSS